MQKIVWHYFCRVLSPNSEKYTKYLLISIDSLIRVAKVEPTDIFVSLDCDSTFNNIYLQKIIDLKVNISECDKYKNQTKCTNLYRVLKQNTDIDKIVQIDCDTIITDSDIVSKISQLDGAVSHTTINWPIIKVIDSRDGQKHPTYGAEKVVGNADHSRNLLFSVCKKNQARYGAFKSFLNILYDIDLDQIRDTLEQESRMFVGYTYILSPKIMPESFLKFIAAMDLFFGDDEMIFTLAREYSGLKYDDINKNGKIVMGTETISDFQKYKGILHFPVKDDLIVDDVESMVQRILND